MKNNTSTYQHTKLTMDQNINPMEAGFSIFAERQIRHLRSFRTPNQNGGWLQQYYITNNITSPEVYIDMIQEIRMANPNDSIFIYINSEGGEVDTGIQIINAIQECNCDVVTVLEGRAYSIAGVIFLAGDIKVVQPNGSLMLHNYSAGISGKGHELLHSIEGFAKYISKLFRSVIQPFISDQEFEQMLTGRDFWFSGEDVIARLEQVGQTKMLESLKQRREELVEMIDELKDEMSAINDAIKDMEPKPIVEPVKRVRSTTRKKLPPTPPADAQLLQEAT